MFRFCVLLIAVASTGCLAGTDEEWNEFKAKHDKSYLHPQREAARRAIWEKTQEKIDEHNSKAANGEISYTLAHNQYSDMTEIEKATVKGVIIPEGLENDASSRQFFMPLPKALPTTVDLRTSSCMSPIKDQGYCGSCWSFSATAMVDYYNCKKKGSLTTYSQQHLVDCDTKDNGCNGGFYTDAWTWLQSTGGQCLLSNYNYTSGTTQVAGTCKTCTRSGTVAGVQWVGTDVTSIKTALATVGPLSVAMDANDNFMHYSSGLYKDTTCTTNVNHAVALVGYGTWTDGSFYWIVRNSWGTSWGVNGYAYVKAGSCGIEAYPAYPIV